MIKINKRFDSDILSPLNNVHNNINSNLIVSPSTKYRAWKADCQQWPKRSADSIQAQSKERMDSQESGNRPLRTVFANRNEGAEGKRTVSRGLPMKPVLEMPTKQGCILSVKQRCSSTALNYQ